MLDPTKKNLCVSALYCGSALNIFNFYFILIFYMYLYMNIILIFYMASESYFPTFSTIFDYTLLILHNKMLRVGAKT